MNDKLVAMLVTFVVVFPLYAMCCLGPATVIGSVAGLLGWFSGSVGLGLAGLVTTAALLMCWRGHRAGRITSAASPDASYEPPASSCCTTKTPPLQFPDRVVVKVGIGRPNVEARR